MAATDETRTIASHLATHPWFPIEQPDNDGKAVRPSVAHVEAAGSTLRVTVTDADAEGSVRHYVADVRQLSGAAVPAGGSGGGS